MRLDAYMALGPRPPDPRLLRHPRSPRRRRRLHHRPRDQPDVRRARRPVARPGLGRPGPPRPLRPRRVRPRPRHPDARRPPRRPARCPASSPPPGSGSSRPAPRCGRSRRRPWPSIAPQWASRPAELPTGPLFAVANEFLDALPIRQVQRTDAAWRDRMVVLSGDDARLRLEPAAPRRRPRRAVPRSSRRRRRRARRGRRGPRRRPRRPHRRGRGRGPPRRLRRLGRLRRHPAGAARPPPRRSARRPRPGRPHRPRPLPGHRRGRPSGRAPGAPRGQGVFLERLGITARARALARGRAEPEVAAVAAAHRRLTHPDEMGNLFQVLALLPGAAPPPPGFE